MFEVGILKQKKHRVNYLWLPRQISMYTVVLHVWNHGYTLRVPEVEKLPVLYPELRAHMSMGINTT